MCDGKETASVTPSHHPSQRRSWPRSVAFILDGQTAVVVGPHPSIRHAVQPAVLGTCVDTAAKGTSRHEATTPGEQLSTAVELSDCTPKLFRRHHAAERPIVS